MWPALPVLSWELSNQPNNRTDRPSGNTLKKEMLPLGSDISRVRGCKEASQTSGPDPHTTCHYFLILFLWLTAYTRCGLPYSSPKKEELAQAQRTDSVTWFVGVGLKWTITTVQPHTVALEGAGREVPQGTASGQPLCMAQEEVESREYTSSWVMASDSDHGLANETQIQPHACFYK